MLKPSPVSLNQISYDAVIRMLATIQDPNSCASSSSGNQPISPPLITDIFIDTVGTQYLITFITHFYVLVS